MAERTSRRSHLYMRLKKWSRQKIHEDSNLLVQQSPEQSRDSEIDERHGINPVSGETTGTPSTKLGIYKYEVLPTKDQDAVRILTLFPGHPEDRLEISLKAITMKRLPSYTALSYVWGSSELTKDVYICTES